MDTKSLLIGISSFIAGGLLVSIAAVTFDKPEANGSERSRSTMMHSSDLSEKSGDEFDKAFIVEMIDHHEGAIEMAEDAEQNAKHDEIKQMSEDIITDQQKEIDQMKQWYKDWGFGENL